MDFAVSKLHFFMHYFFDLCSILIFYFTLRIAGAVAPFTRPYARPCFEWKWRANVEGFIASFKRIWEHTKRKVRGDCSLHGVAVNPSSNHFLTYCLTISFRLSVHPGTVNMSAHTLLADCCKFEYWYLLHVCESCSFLKAEIIFCWKCKIPYCYLGCTLKLPQCIQCYLQWHATKFMAKNVIQQSLKIS